MNTVVEKGEQIQNTKICFSYIRFSSKIQAVGNSLDRQQPIAERVAKEKGWILREDLNAQDLGVSAFKGDNIKTLKAITDAVRAGKMPKGAVMIIEAFDRFSRADIDTAEDVLKDMLRAGLEIYVDRGGHHLTRESLNKPIDRIIALLELAAANEYSAKLSERLAKAWKAKKAHAADGVKLTRMVPAWLDVQTQIGPKGKPVPVSFSANDKAQIVRRIFQDYASGKGIRTIMRELNDEGVSAFRSKEGWSNTHLRRLLSFRGVLGEYQPCKYEGRKRTPEGPPVPDYYPPIVNKAVFYRVQEMLPKGEIDPETGKEKIDPKTGKRIWHCIQARGTKGNATNLFTGVVKCAKCGGSMVIKRSPAQKGKYLYVSLVCNNALRGNGCGYHTLQYGWLERAVLTTLWSKVLPEMAQTDTRKEKLDRLEGELKDTQAQIKKWMKVVEDSETPPAGVGNKIHALETKEASQKKQIESLSATIQENPLTGWQQVPMTVENRLRLSALLRDQIQSITIDAEKRKATLRTKDPEWEFDMSWESTRGVNQVRKNEANEGFLMLRRKFPYLDHVLVWKSDQNLPLEEVFKNIKFDDELAIA